MTEGQIPAGWYDDGQGQLRWYDGTAWTEHVQPLPAPSAPPVQAQAVQQPADAQAQAQAQAAQAQAAQAQAAQAQAAQAQAAQAQAAQAAPATPESTAAAAMGGAAGATAGTHAQTTESWEQPATPIYRKSWFLVLVGLVVLAVIGGIFALASSGGDDDSGSSATPTAGSTPGGTSAAGGAAFGADAATVAAKAGCANPTPVQAAAATGTGPQPSSKVTCTLGGATYTVVTWASAADQNAQGALANAFTQPVTAGTKYYATAEGWTAFDTTYSQAAAQAFATPAGGTAKGVVVVLASATPAAP